MDDEIDLSIKTYTVYQCVKWLCNPNVNPITSNSIIKYHYDLLYRDTIKNLKPFEIRELNEDMYNILISDEDDLSYLLDESRESNIINIIKCIKMYDKDKKYDFVSKNVLDRLSPEDIYELNSDLFYDLELDKQYEIIEIDLE